MHLDEPRSSRRSASSTSTFNSTQTACRLCAGSKADASNDEGDDLDERTAVRAIGAPTHGQADRQMTGEEQEMGYQSVVAWITDAERGSEKMSRHRWIPGTGGWTLLHYLVSDVSSTRRVSDHPNHPLLESHCFQPARFFLGR